MNSILKMAALASGMLLASLFFPSRAELVAQREQLASEPATG